MSGYHQKSGWQTILNPCFTGKITSGDGFLQQMMFASQRIKQKIKQKKGLSLKTMISSDKQMVKPSQKLGLLFI